MFFKKFLRKINFFIKKCINKFLKIFIRRFHNKFLTTFLTQNEHYLFFYERNKFKSNKTDLQIEAISILKKLDKDGFCIVKNFWDEDKCLEGIKEVEKIMINYPKYLHSDNKSDLRVFGAENISSEIGSFSKNNLLNEIANEYNKKNTQLGFTLGAKIYYRPNNKGSGEGWHRDGFYRQFKALLYLNDVGIRNGPFQLIKDSHKCRNLIKDIKKADLKYMQYRLSEDEISKLISNNPSRLITILGKKGTLILFDTSMLHRGAPIKEGYRYVLTNYYYTNNQIDKELYKRFNVVPKNL